MKTNTANLSAEQLELVKRFRAHDTWKSEVLHQSIEQLRVVLNDTTEPELFRFVCFFAAWSGFYGGDTSPFVVKGGVNHFHLAFGQYAVDAFKPASIPTASAASSFFTNELPNL